MGELVTVSGIITPPEYPPLIPETWQGLPRRNDLPQFCREYKRVVWAQLRDLHERGAGGAKVAEWHSRAVDYLIRGIFDATDKEHWRPSPPGPGGFAVVALGGYGRDELNPHSDLDLMFVHRGRITPFVEAVTESILYSLWDSGFQLGYSVRNMEDVRTQAAGDQTVLSSLLDARLVLGDQTLWNELDSGVILRLLQGRGDEFIRQKLEEADARRQRFGGSVYVLEPHVKMGEGGLRDLHLASWVARARFGVHSFHQMMMLGLLSQREWEEIESNRGFMLEVRNELHYLADKKDDRLTFAWQNRISERHFQHAPENNGRQKPVERFMRRYYLSARAIVRLSRMIVERCTFHRAPKERRPSYRIDEHFRVFRGALTISDYHLFLRRPELLMQAFLLAAKHNVPLYSYMREGIVSLLDEWSAAVEPVRGQVGRMFLELLRDPSEGAAQAFETLHELGVLVRLIPEFGNIAGLHIHDLYHVYTVDVHTVRAVNHLKALLRGAHADREPLLTAVARELKDPGVLLLGMLLHDVGKGFGAGHSERGASWAPAVVERLGMDPEVADDLAFLIRDHLIMSHNAQRRDINDDELIAGFAQQVGSPERLRMLYCLTYADISNVGPDLWNEWKSMLLRELYRKTLDMMTSGANALQRLEKAQQAREKVIATLSRHYPVENVKRFVSRLDRSTVLDAGATETFRFYRLWSLVRDGRTAIRFRRNLPKGCTRVFIACKDRPGLLAMIAEVLAANGVNVLDANIVTTRDGIVLNSFRVAAPRGGALVDQRIQERIGRELFSMMDGEIAPGELYRRKEKYLDNGRRDAPAPEVKVEIDTAASRDFTVVDLRSPDRTGVLYQASRVFFESGMLIELARVTTEGAEAHDAFYVRDRETGLKVTDPGRLDSLRVKLSDELTRFVHGAA
ncbi:MAG: Bifunctional uridylyltransferase/uridylyl-removing enzyme [Myxococcota bacterium]|nr:Bifunctional uridylyltransferase/uridylyl-removing enzyme [Myxococcota bacterium]